MIKLFDATLDLFIYHLSEGLGENQSESCEYYQNFWSNLPTKLQQSQAVVEPDPKDSNHLDFHKSISAHTIHGSYRRATIDDTESLWFDCWVYVTEEILDILPQFKSLVPEKISEESYLGQTWMISGWLDTDMDLDYKVLLAKQTYKSLLDQEPQYQQQGNFLGATVFEFWCGDEQWDGIEKDSHVLVILYDQKHSFVEAANYYHDWRYLFYCRHKILWAYEQAMQLRSQLVKDYAKSIPDVSNLSQKNLQELKVELQTNIETLARYVGNLNRLETQLHTVEINLRHYKISCKKSFKNLDFLAELTRIATDKYKTQIEEDHASLRPGLSIRENLTSTIRGMVEIQQAESDRNLEKQNSKFQNKVAIIGVGVGTASVAASVVSPFLEAITQQPSKKTVEGKDILFSDKAWLNVGAGLGISISLGILASLFVFAWLVLPRWLRKTKLFQKKSPHS